MKTTAAALRELQDHFAGLDPKPNVRELAKMAGMSYSTAARYLNGTTRQCLPDKVRALAHAIGRDDIMAEVTADTPTKNADAWWIIEIQRTIREEYTEQLERERQLRKESESRFERIVAEKDERINELMKDKTSLFAQLSETRAQKRRYEFVALALLLAFGVYVILHGAIGY